MKDCLFCMIGSGQIPSTSVFRDSDFYAFRDVHPQAPTHVLVIPLTHYRNAAEMATTDPERAGRLLRVATDVAGSLGLAEAGYRLVTNTGVEAGQSVDHFHVHVLGGRRMTWPPG